MAKLTFDAKESFYELRPGEKAGLAHWLDVVTATCEPEDMSGEVIISNFIEDDKWKIFAHGKVNAILQRLPYEKDTVDLTDTVISGDEIYETNASKGVYFSIANPALGKGYANYHIGFMASEFEHPRHTGTAYLKLYPPNNLIDDYNFMLDFSIHPEFGSGMYHDLTNYTIPAKQNRVRTEVACDAIDITKGVLQFHPLDLYSYQHSSLEYHCKFISHILGIEFPEFLAIS